MVPSVFAYGADPNWFDNRWYTMRSRPKRRPLGRGLARLASLVLLLSGGTAAMEQGAASGQHNAGAVSFLGEPKDLFVYYMA